MIFLETTLSLHGFLSLHILRDRGGLNEKSPRSALYRTERRTRFFLVKSAPCGARTHDLRIIRPNTVHSHRDTPTPTQQPRTGAFILPFYSGCVTNHNTQRRENHALGTASKQLYDLATRLRKSKINNRHTRTLDSIPRTCLPTRICFDNNR